MKFKVSEHIFNDQAKKLLFLSGAKELPPPITFGEVVSRNLLEIDPQRPPTPEEKVKRYTILQKFLSTQDNLIDLTIDDISLIKKIVDNSCSPLVHGRVLEILNSPISDPKPA